MNNEKIIYVDEETGVMIEEMPRFRDQKGKFVKTNEVVSK